MGFFLIASEGSGPMNGTAFNQSDVLPSFDGLTLSRNHLLDLRIRRQGIGSIDVDLKFHRLKNDNLSYLVRHRI